MVVIPVESTLVDLVTCYDLAVPMCTLATTEGGAISVKWSSGVIGGTMLLEGNRGASGGECG